jgi:hypothetical protein
VQHQQTGITHILHPAFILLVAVQEQHPETAEQVAQAEVQ